MKKMGVRFTLNLAVIGVAVSLGTALAGGDSQDDFYGNFSDPIVQAQQQTAARVSSGVSDRVAQNMMPKTEDIVANVGNFIGGIQGVVSIDDMSNRTSNTAVAMPSLSVSRGRQDPGQQNNSGRQQQRDDGSFMPQVDIGQVIDSALQSVSPQMHNQMSDRITDRALTSLERGSDSMTAARRNVRNGIMYGRFRDIYPFASNNYRAAIMPHAITSMINQIQPYRFPDRFRSRMMPRTIRTMSDQIKQRQKAYMQEGIMGNPNFPDFPDAFYQGRMQ